MNRSDRGIPVVAITGGIGCGKSAVAEILRTDGVPVLDADEVARDVVRPGSEALPEIVRQFGREVLRPDGSLDRRKLASIVFDDAGKLKSLNAIIHPLVRDRMQAWVAEQRAAQRSCAGVIPLLFETGAERGWDFVICVASHDDISRRRLLERGWSDAEIEARRKAQMNVEEKMQRACWVIENNGTLEELKLRVRAAWNKILKQESQHG